MATDIDTQYLNSLNKPNLDVAYRAFLAQILQELLALRGGSASSRRPGEGR